MNDEPSWQRQLAVGLAALVAVAVLVGGIVAVAALRAADYVGIGGTSTTSRNEPLLPTTGAPTTSGPTTTPPLQPSQSPSPSGATTTRRPITLVARPRAARSYERVNLSGSYPGGDGASLQVQRSIGAGTWSDFPTRTTVQAGRFATYVQTAMTGVNHFRVLDAATGKISNAVTVTIR